MSSALTTCRSSRTKLRHLSVSGLPERISEQTFAYWFVAIGRSERSIKPSSFSSARQASTRICSEVITSPLSMIDPSLRLMFFIAVRSNATSTATYLANVSKSSSVAAEWYPTSDVQEIIPKARTEPQNPTRNERQCFIASQRSANREPNCPRDNHLK